MPVPVSPPAWRLSGLRAFALASIACSNPGAVVAQDVVGMAACARIADAAARLACYDKEAGRPVDELPVPPSSIVPAPPMPPVESVAPGVGVPGVADPAARPSSRSDVRRSPGAAPAAGGPTPKARPPAAGAATGPATPARPASPAATGSATPTQGAPTESPTQGTAPAPSGPGGLNVSIGQTGAMGATGAAGTAGSTADGGQAGGRQPTPPLANPPATPVLPSLSDPVPPDVLRPADPSVRLARESLDQRRSLGSNLADRWELDDEYDRGRFLLRPYKPMYVLFGDWTTRINQRPTSPNPLNTATTSQQLTNTEAKFQISFKTKVLKDMIAGNGDLWLAYTQQSFWQIYNPEKSRPFRETNYEPEIMTVFRTNYSVLGWQGRMIGLALNHQSNGYDAPLSRNWNRVIAQFGFERRNWSLMIRPWWRIPETGGTDDNPDITDYAGRMDVLLVRQSGGHEWSLLARHSLRGGSRSHGGVQLGYAWPISSYLKGYAQIFSGYGSSLLDYNHRQTRIGIGISLVQWL